MWDWINMASSLNKDITIIIIISKQIERALYINQIVISYEYM